MPGWAGPQGGKREGKEKERVGWAQLEKEGEKNCVQIHLNLNLKFKFKWKTNIKQCNTV
jgi:hypothetical protein